MLSLLKEIRNAAVDADVPIANVGLIRSRGHLWVSNSEFGR